MPSFVSKVHMLLAGLVVLIALRNIIFNEYYLSAHEKEIYRGALGALIRSPVVMYDAGRQKDYIKRTARNLLAGGSNREALLKPEDDNYMAGCLLVMDENFRLREWLAYHHHVLPLKRLIVAVDPDSKTSPDEIFDQYRKELGMLITTWTDDDLGAWEPLPARPNVGQKRDRHRTRQARFLKQCMQHLSTEGWTWTALWDTDEYLTFNGFDEPKPTLTNNSTLVTSPIDLSESGSALNYIKKYGEDKCIPIYRILVGAKYTEDPEQNHYTAIDYRRFDTLHFLY